MQKTIYKTLQSITAANPQHLTAYQTDLTYHDRRTLQSSVAGDQFVWVLREHGTDLLSLPDTTIRQHINKDSTEILRLCNWNLGWLKAVYQEHLPPIRSIGAITHLITVERSQYGSVEMIEPALAVELLEQHSLEQIWRAKANEGFNSTPSLGTGDLCIWQRR